MHEAATQRGGQQGWGQKRATMPELSVVILATNNEQRSLLQALVDGTNVARTVFASGGMPVAATDPLLRRILGAAPDVVLVNIDTEETAAALRAIELLHQEIPAAAIFALGIMTQPQLIVNAMRAGAREFLERPVNTTDLLEAFVRLTTAQRRHRKETQRGKVFAVVNAKGGSGATTLAVNLGLALQSVAGQAALIDLAPLGHAALHLNLKATFSITDALRNLHRMDSSLLESFMTRHADGLLLLAGSATPMQGDLTTPEFARLFDMLVTQYRYVVVDLSTRVDATARLVANLAETVLLVAQTDVASLWSAGRISQFLSEAGNRDRIRLVLNRFRKIPGFSEADAEAAAGVKLIWKVPNHYFAVTSSIDRGMPLVRTGNAEVSRSFSGLAHLLTEDDETLKRQSWSMFRTV